MLQTSKSIFDKVFKYGPAAYIILAPDSPRFTIVDVNDAYLSVTRTNRNEIVGKGMFEIFPGNPESFSSGTDLLKESLLKVLLEKDFQKMPMHRYDIYDTIKGDFVKKYWTGINTPLFDDNGEVFAIVHSPLDVTYTYELSKKEKEIVRALHKQRNDLFAVFKHVPVGIGIFKGRELFVELANDELCHLLGVKQEEIMGKSIYDVLHNVAVDNFRELLHSSLHSNHPFVGYELPIKVVRNDRPQEVYINFAYEQLKDDDDQQSGIIIAANDVSAQVITRKKLEESEQRLNLAVMASNLGVWDTNLITRKSIRSLRYAQIFGYRDTSDEWTIEAFFNHIIAEDIERVRTAHLKAYDTGIVNCQFRIKTLDNKIKWVHLIGEVQRDKMNKAIRMLGTITDITELKELEKLKDEFISTVSHEIKTPVTSIKAYGQLLQRKLQKENNPENVYFLKKMDNQINRLTSLVHHLLDATRIDSNKMLFNPVAFDLNTLTKEIVEEMQQITPNHTLSFSPCNESLVFADIERIRQVITNMITNAVKYSPNANAVEVFIFNKDGFANLCVRDFGIGIAASQIDKIFDRFYQADERANVSPGLGLGLYISYEIIKRQEGEMWVQSKLEKGSDFFFKLPLRTK